MHLRARLFLAAGLVADGKSVYEVRKNIGAELSREAPVEADYVVPVPDSGVPAAIGFSQASGIPFELGIIRSHYVGRTFIQPSQEVRNLGVKLKHNANSALVDGKRIVLIDDSIVRGTTSVKIVQMMRDAGAARGPFADRLAADAAQLLLRRRHARARQAARRADERRGDVRLHQRRQPRLRLDRGPVPRARRRSGTTRSRNAATPASPATIRPRLTDFTEKERAGAAFPGRQPLIDLDLWPNQSLFTGKLALVTGASRGIGAATAEALAAAGAHVILVARTASALESVDDRIHDAGGTATIAPLDLTDSDSIAKLAAAVAERWDALDILVLNAAMLGSLTPVEHIDAKEYARSSASTWSPTRR